MGSTQKSKRKQQIMQNPSKRGRDVVQKTKREAGDKFWWLPRRKKRSDAGSG